MEDIIKWMLETSELRYLGISFLTAMFVWKMVVIPLQEENKQLHVSLQQLSQAHNNIHEALSEMAQTTAKQSGILDAFKIVLSYKEQR